LLWLAYQDSIDSAIGTSGAKGVSPKALTQTIKKRLENYDKGKVIEERIARDSRAAENEMLELSLGYNGLLAGYQQNEGTANRTGERKSPEFYAKQMDDIAPTSPGEDFGLLGKVKAERKKAKMARKEAEAKRLFQEAQERKKKYSRSAEPPKKETTKLPTPLTPKQAGQSEILRNFAKLQQQVQDQSKAEYPSVVKPATLNLNFSDERYDAEGFRKAYADLKKRYPKKTAQQLLETFKKQLQQ
jgi:hypothetical protein